MKRTLFYIFLLLLLAACQREIHFPSDPVSIPIPEKVVTSVVIADPGRNNYDSVVYNYGDNRIIEAHYSKTGITNNRTFYYDAESRLSKIEDDKHVYLTNNNAARRIRFVYDNSGNLLQTETDFTGITGIKADLVNRNENNEKQIVVYDTSYNSAGYNLQWVNRIIYTRLNSRNYLVFDSSINRNTSNAALVKTLVSSYSYGTDSTVVMVETRAYFNGLLSEWSRATVTADKPSPVHQSFRRKLFRNLSNWFDAGSIWQDDSYDLFPLPGGPYKSILLNGMSTDGSPVPIPFSRNYVFKNTYSGDQLDKSEITYTLSGQGTNNYVTVVRYFYGYL